MHVERHGGVELGAVALVVEHRVDDVGALPKQRTGVGVVGICRADDLQFLVPNACLRLDEGHVSSQAEVVQGGADGPELLAAFKFQAVDVGVGNVGPRVLGVHRSENGRLLDRVGEALVEDAGAEHLAQVGVALQTQVDVVDGGLLQVGVAFQGLQPLEVERAERRLLTEHRTGDRAAVGEAQVGHLDRVQFTQGVRQVHAGHEVQFVQTALQAVDLLRREVVDHVDFPAADAHVGRLDAEADVAREALALADVQHAVPAPDVHVRVVGIHQVGEQHGGQVAVASAVGVDHEVVRAEVGVEVAVHLVQEVGVGRLKPKLVLLVLTRGAHEAGAGRKLEVFRPSRFDGLLEVHLHVRAVFLQLTEVAGGRGVQALVHTVGGVHLGGHVDVVQSEGAFVVDLLNHQVQIAAPVRRNRAVVHKIVDDVFQVVYVVLAVGAVEGRLVGEGEGLFLVVVEEDAQVRGV